jgi:hypothetical protein
VLTAAIETADKGITVDLAGLDEQISTLCTQARTLPPASGRRLLGDLEVLMRRLNELEASIARQRDTLRDAAEGRTDAHTVRRQAAAAYAKTPSLSPDVDSADPPDTKEAP